MEVSEQQIEASIKYWRRKVIDVKNQIAELEKQMCFNEGCLNVWQQLKSDNERINSESDQDEHKKFKIPYIFIPGTKAKADEVNANFKAIAEHINKCLNLWQKNKIDNEKGTMPPDEFLQKEVNIMEELKKITEREIQQ